MLPALQWEPAAAEAKCQCLTNKDIMDAFTITGRRHKLVISGFQLADTFGSSKLISVSRNEIESQLMKMFKIRTIPSLITRHELIGCSVIDCHPVSTHKPRIP